MKKNSDIKQFNSELFDSAIAGDNKKLKNLLSQGAEIDSRHDLGATPLFAAVTFNKPATVKLLIEEGADIELPINSGTTPLFKSAHSCHPRITKLLVENRADKEVVVNGYTALYAAISSGCIQDAKILLEAGALIHSDTVVDTPILVATQEQNSDFKHQQLYKLVRENYSQELETTLPKLNASLSINNLKTFEVVVVRYNEDLSWLNSEFKNERIIIYNKGKDDLKDLPVNSEVINIPNVGWFGGTILYHLANQYETLADRTLFLQGEPYEQHLFLPLIRYKGNIDSKCQNIVAKCVESSLLKQSDHIVAIAPEDWAATKYGGKFELFANYTMIDFAHQYIDTDILPEAPLGMVWGAQFAVDKTKVYLHKKEFYQRMLPLFNKQYPMEDFFLEKLWDPMFKAKPLSLLNDKLYEAASLGNNEDIIELLNQGADIDSKHTLEATPLFAAVYNNQTSTVKLLIENGANLNLPINSGEIPLHRAALNCHLDIIKLLVEMRTNTEVLTYSDKHSPLYHAIYSGCVEGVRTLLEAGATSYTDITEETALRYAKYTENRDLAHKEISDLVFDYYWKGLEATLPKLNASLSINNSKTFEVVVVRYNEDLSWLNREFENERIIIYNKGEDDLKDLPVNSEVINIPNVGWFGGTILYHLVNNYNILADRTLFLQGEPYEQPLFLPLIRHKSDLKSSCHGQSIIGKGEETTLQMRSDEFTYGHTEEEWATTKYAGKFKLFTNYTMIDFAHEYVDKDIPLESPLCVVWGAEFAVDKARVYFHEKEFYQKMLPLFNETYPMADFYLEKLWDSIFQVNITKLNEKLFNAAIAGDNEEIVKLLADGADINSRHELDATPLLAAVAFNKPETVKLFIEKGADIELPTNSGVTPLYKSVLNCNSEITKLLLDNGANKEVKVDSLYTPLYAAIANRCISSVDYLLGMNASILSDNLRSPLYITGKLRDVSEEHQEINKMIMNEYWKILENYPSLSLSSNFEVVVVRYKEDLSWVISEFKTEKVTVYNKGYDDLEYLPANCQVINIPNIGWLGGTYLLHIVNNYASLAENILFIQGYPYDTEAFFPLARYKDNLNSTCTNIVAKCEKSTLKDQNNKLAFLKDRDAIITEELYSCFNEDVIDYDVIEFVHEFIDPYYDPELNLYVDLGAQFAVTADQIHMHPKEYYEKMLSLFNTRCPKADFYLEKVWDIMFQSKNITKLNEGLFNAALVGDNEAIELLLHQGAEIDSQHNLGATSLFAAVTYNQTEAVKLLVKKGANIELAINTGITPLWKSVHSCHSQITKILLDKGANTEVIVGMYAPMYVAISNECIPNVKYLLEAGASIYSDALSYHDIFIPLFLNSFKYNSDDVTKEMEEIYPLVLNHYWNITANEIKEIDERTINNTKTFEVVVVRYKEDLSWVAKEFPHDKVTIYNKGPDDIGELPSNCKVVTISNVGYLGGTYLKHIVDNYNHLADRTLFTQGHPYDSSVFLPLIRYKETLNTNCRNIIAKCVNTTLAQEWNFLESFDWENMPRYKDFVPRDANMIEYTHKYVGNITLDEIIYVSYGAIFAVDKDKILNHPVEHYEAILPEFNYTKPMADHFQERLWDPLFELHY